MTSCRSDNECVLITFHGEESWGQATSTALWINSQQAHGVSTKLWPYMASQNWFNCHTSSALLKTMHALCTHRNFVHRAIGLVCIHISWP